MSLKLFKNSLQKAPIIKKGNYSYIIHPILDGVPQINPDVFNEVVSEMQKRIEKCGKLDKIVTIEAMGIPLASVLSLKLNVPLIIIRKKPYNLPGEITVEQKTGYSKSKLYINKLKENENIVIVDDLVSTGGTLKAALSGLKKINVKIKGVFIAVNKGKAVENLKNEFYVDINSLIDIEVINDKIIIKNN